MKIATSKVHFIGIGGIGMCGLAELLHNMGAQVTGSDMQSNAQTEYLKNIGITVFKGHKASQVSDVDVVVYSSAVKPDNVEFVEAKERKIPLIPRAEALAEIMLLKKGLAVAGTHGKTTTTSLASNIFLEAGVEPSIFVGGRVDKLKSTAQLGKGEWLIAEADESDGSFLRLSPFMGIITNIDSDHLDYYGSFEKIQQAFYDVALKIPFYGTVIVYGDDERNKELFKDFPKKIVFYGFNKGNDYRLEDGNGSYSIYKGNEKLGELSVPMPGIHNALNSLAASVAGLEAGFDFEACKKGIEGFTGVARRSHKKGEKNQVLVFDDYGHHPTEVQAVINAFKKDYPNNRLVVVFEPHRFTRTRDCWEGFVKSFDLVDVLFVIDIYPAGEAPIENITAKRLYDEIPLNKKTYLDFSTHSANSSEDLLSLFQSHVDIIYNSLQEGDLLLTLGAGKVYKIGEAFLKI